MQGICRPVIILFALFSLGAFAIAQGNDSSNSGNALSQHDQQFLNHLAKDSQGEVQVSQFVLGKTSNPQVKEFAQRMVHDHSMLDSQLQQVLSKHGMSMPQPMTAQQSQLMQKLQGLSGKQLDKAYMQAAVKGHEQDVAKISPFASQEAKLQPANADVAETAKESLAVIKQHLQLARQVAQQVGAPSSGKQ